MSAKDYPITFPYGATSEPYSASHPHRGDDRACPTGTPVVIGSTTIGLTGATGRATGPHLHIQEWQDKPANTRKPRNSFKGGTVTAVATSVDFGKYVTITSGGWNTTYAHLSKQNVKVGQVITDKETLVLEEQRPVFRADYYLKTHKDVAKAGYTVKTAVNHWKQYGIKEGRASAPNFHVKEYLANYGDLRRVYGDKGYAKAVKHYYNHGINEGRSGRKRNIVVNKAEETLNKIKELLK